MIEEHINLGRLNKLRILRDTDPGLYLCSQDEEEVVLLPNIYVTNSMQLDDIIEVFIYTDSEDRLVATTLTPKAMVDEYVALKVVDSMKYGAFLDWGLPKDLLIPKNHQKSNFNVGNIKVVRVVEDTETNRLFATEKFEPYLLKSRKNLKKDQEVELIIYYQTPLGYKVLIDKAYDGLIFKNEIFQNIKLGDKITGYIKEIRKDGKIDVSLQPIGKKNIGDISTNKVLDVIKEHNGKIDFTYKSDANDINKTFGLSKKSFKKALTTLIENNIIKLEGESLFYISNS
jgi:predicted RNA-binding protein (virulence factor B family)